MPTHAARTKGKDARSQAQDTLQVEDCRPMSDTACSHDIVLIRLAGEISFGPGRNPTVPVGRILVTAYFNASSIR
jgi:hypothetical protein